MPFLAIVLRKAMPFLTIVFRQSMLFLAINIDYWTGDNPLD
jgi:hypothetical protein